ncbi:MAG TPA: hypothetical protein ENJ38_12030 [Rhodospirillales bacterium]|nr:hypothetical protein [Rhodospirillales bacterium]
MSETFSRGNRTATGAFRPWNAAFLTTSRWASALVILLASLLLFSLNLERPAHPDELYHILPARGLLETGEPRIGEGLYLRAYPYTWIVAQSFAWFGESLASARLPSVIATAALVAILFLWLWREAGPGAAWIGAGLYAISPFAVQIAQFTRFYAVQSLFFVIGSLLVYELLLRPGSRGRALLLGLAAAASFAFAALLQPTTLMGVTAVAAWAAPLLAWRWWREEGVPRWRRWAPIAAGLLVVLAGFGLAWESGLLAKAWHMYRSTPLFNAATRDQFWFYHARYILFYPTLWAATGLLAVAALAFLPRPGWFAVVLFAVSFLLNSFAGPKNMRYIAYAQPFMFVVWGLGLVAVWPWLRAGMAKLRERLDAQLGTGFPKPRMLARLLIGLALAFLVLANPFWLRTVTLLADIPVPPEKPSVRWELAVPALAPWLARVDVVVTAEELGTLYYLGRYDIAFNISKRGELPPEQRRDFGIDPRTGRPVIGSVAALERVWRCTSSGLFVSPERRWGTRTSVFPEAATFIESRMRRLELPPASRLRAYVWEHEPAGDDPACAELPPLGKPRS